MGFSAERGVKRYPALGKESVKVLYERGMIRELFLDKNSEL